MPNYAVEITARTGCGCEATLVYELEDGDVPDHRDVGALLYTSLDPAETDLLEFLTDHRHGNAGYEKISVTAQVKVR